MGPPQGPYILQLCMGPSYFLGGLTPPYFAHWLHVALYPFLHSVVLPVVIIKHKTMMKCDVKSNFIIKAKLSV